jgi:hypothetical protein
VNRGKRKDCLEGRKEGSDVFAGSLTIRLCVCVCVSLFEFVSVSHCLLFTFSPGAVSTVVCECADHTNGLLSIFMHSLHFNGSVVDSSVVDN